MKKLLLGLLICLTAMTTVFAEGQKDDGSYKVGYTFTSSQDVFQNLLMNEVVKDFEAKGVEVMVIDPMMDIEKQLAAVETFITQRVDLVMVNALDYEGLAPAVENCRKAGIPFVNLGSKVAGEDIYYVGSQHYDSGYIEGDYMAKVLPENAKVVYLGGTPGMDHSIDRRRGIQDALLNKRPDVELLSEQAADYDRTRGMKVMEDWLQVFPQIDGVIAANDQMALGALEALRGANRAKGVMIAGIDGTLEAKQYVKSGEFAITVLQDAAGQAQAAVDVALNVLAGEQKEKNVFVPYKPITKENIDEYLK